MIQSRRLDSLLEYLLEEDKKYASIQIPELYNEKKELFDWLMHVRPVTSFSKDFRQTYTEFLQEEKARMEKVTIQDLTPIQPHFYIWKGSLNYLETDAILSRQSSVLENELLSGSVSLAGGPGLNSKIIHTEIPSAEGSLTGSQYNRLHESYWNALEEASRRKCRSIAFDTESAKNSGFPLEVAVRIAVNTISEYMRRKRKSFNIVFNVSADDDYRLYEKLLSSR